MSLSGLAVWPIYKLPTLALLMCVMGIGTLLSRLADVYKHIVTLNLGTYKMIKDPEKGLLMYMVKDETIINRVKDPTCPTLEKKSFLLVFNEA